ncbi:MULTISPECIES: nicotinate-nucleotide adenylyltransferase [unclassified Corynebacterium]|uniref:nicotinate-nucleotide adenylyltransferase n=1 Tax=unclassified Corynebacterium TaxID=2624378 RepID=UPI0029CA2351|nr:MULTISPECIES: nicotinate-nucleotide adenylyltransferase [unclassified Corynebacterium]WPF65592.1 nicotinate-nucleotide adenylyltransferase [Corynebacterium sp. 22KM0430]WPF68087.1 nicotinate-nucleotide adenylyltransferase [Corynebacterium sp. 21KM1197]
MNNREATAPRIGVMGGTFDPIHHGHLAAASEAADQCGLDGVVFVPTGQPWQKVDKKVSAAEDRYLMTALATAEDERFSVSRVDIERGGNTYTIDTLRDLRAQFPQAELFFIAGADALSGITSWRNWQEVLSLARFIGVTRPGYELTRDDLPLEYSKYGDRITLVQAPGLDISSTQCRRRRQQGRPIRYLVPGAVARYIEQNGLYAG